MLNLEFNKTFYGVWEAKPHTSLCNLETDCNPNNLVQITLLSILIFRTIGFHQINATEQNTSE